MTFNPDGTVRTPETPKNEAINLNSAVTALASNSVSVGASSAATLVLSAAPNPVPGSILMGPTVIPVTPIYVRYGYGAVSVASASAFDDFFTETYQASQVGIPKGCTHVSFFSTTACTILVVQKN